MFYWKNKQDFPAIKFYCGVELDWHYWLSRKVKAGKIIPQKSKPQQGPGSHCMPWYALRNSKLALLYFEDKIDKLGKELMRPNLPMKIKTSKLFT